MPRLPTAEALRLGDQGWRRDARRAVEALLLRWRVAAEPGGQLVEALCSVPLVAMQAALQEDWICPSVLRAWMIANLKQMTIQIIFWNPWLYVCKHIALYINIAGALSDQI
ncbi:hypothetical protein [Oryza sativa Japonica Group]|uniref:Uncharacterized protein n=1 Tax=Oryza sativa subsp. japonica TaxID=39947 RepID=Q5QN68_ORYSJ|nr:hypothetical protein [Oryza sativa Japonica Group]